MHTLWKPSLQCSSGDGGRCIASLMRAAADTRRKVCCLSGVRGLWVDVTQCYPNTDGSPPSGNTPCMGNGGAVYVGNTANTSNTALVTATFINVSMVWNAAGGGGGIAFKHSVVVLLDVMMDRNYALEPGQGVGGCVIGMSASSLPRLSLSCLNPGKDFE